jgi:Holliday junction resolvase
MKAVKYKFPISEDDIKNQVKDYLDLKGYFHFPLLAGMGSYKGIPDRIAIKGGRVLFLEIKKPAGWKQSDEQKEFQANIERVGGEYYLVRSLEEIMKILEIDFKRAVNIK